MESINVHDLPRRWLMACGENEEQTKKKLSKHRIVLNIKKEMSIPGEIRFLPTKNDKTCEFKLRRLEMKQSRKTGPSKWLAFQLPQLVVIFQALGRRLFCRQKLPGKYRPRLPATLRRESAGPRAKCRLPQVIPVTFPRKRH